jgi:hypothetical protein
LKHDDGKHDAVSAAERLGREETGCEFGTPWSPPVAWVVHVSRLFPTLTITLDFREPNTDFKGCVVALAGQITERVEDACWRAAVQNDPERVLLELRPGREFVVYERAEKLPHLRAGDDPVLRPAVRLPVWQRGNGCYYVYALSYGPEVRVAVLTDAEDLRDLCRHGRGTGIVPDGLGDGLTGETAVASVPTFDSDTPAGVSADADTGSLRHRTGFFPGTLPPYPRPSSGATGTHHRFTGKTVRPHREWGLRRARDRRPGKPVDGAG